MILIWDDGGQYSDHSVYFVDCGNLSADDVVSFARLSAGPYRNSYEIARCETLDWRDKSAMSKPIDLTYHVYVLFDQNDDSDVSGITTAALAYLIDAFPHSISSRVRDEYARRLERL